MRKTKDEQGRIRIDEKHSIEIIADTPCIVKSSNNQPIPDDEPRILFRGRDKLALPMLYFYQDLCIKDGCTTFQMESMNVMLVEFERFKSYSLTMKQPGITKGE